MHINGEGRGCCQTLSRSPFRLAVIPTVPNHTCGSLSGRVGAAGRDGPVHRRAVHPPVVRRPLGVGHAVDLGVELGHRAGVAVGDDLGRCAGFVQTRGERVELGVDVHRVSLAQRLGGCAQAFLLLRPLR